MFKLDYLLWQVQNEFSPFNCYNCDPHSVISILLKKSKGERKASKFALINQTFDLLSIFEYF